MQKPSKNDKIYAKNVARNQKSAKKVPRNYAKENAKKLKNQTRVYAKCTPELNKKRCKNRSKKLVEMVGRKIARNMARTFFRKYRMITNEIMQNVSKTRQEVCKKSSN